MQSEGTGARLVSVSRRLAGRTASMLDWGFCAYGDIDLAGQRLMSKGGIKRNRQGMDVAGNRCHLPLIDGFQGNQVTLSN